MFDVEWTAAELPIELRECWQEREAILLGDGFSPEEARHHACAEVLARVHATDPDRAQRLAWTMEEDLQSCIALHSGRFPS
jgi:hypothetical protein